MKAITTCLFMRPPRICARHVCAPGARIYSTFGADMRKNATVLSLAFLGAAVAYSGLAAQAGHEAPYWAYGYMKPAAPGESAPPCPPNARPFPDCAYPAAPVADDGVKRQLPGSTQSFTR